jgi:hypothetical protein
MKTDRKEMKRTALLCVVAGCVLLAPAFPSESVDSDGGRQAADRGHLNFTVQPPPSTGRSSRLSARRGDARGSRDSTRRLTTLPERVAGRRVAAYDMLRTPALSNLAGRSFFWRTRTEDQGRHRLLFRARFDTTAAAAGRPAADTLAVVVRVTSG